MDDLKNLNPQYFEQMSLGLDIDELDEGVDVVYTHEEKSRRSMGARDVLEKVLGEDPDKAHEWYKTYLQLVNSKWPWRVACYVAWASSPKNGRWPKTQDELATSVLGLTSDRVIATWRKKSPDIDGAISLLQSATMLEHRADVFKALVASASDKDHRSNPDRKLYFEMTGDHIPRSRLDVTRPSDPDNLSNYSDQELYEIARRAKKETSPDPSHLLEGETDPEEDNE